MSRENGNKFNVRILFRSGVEKVFESYSFDTSRDRVGNLTKLSWDLVDETQLLYIRLEDIALIYCDEIKEKE